MAEKVILLVEGKGDENVVKHLFRHHKIVQPHLIKDKQGIENLLETLDVEIDASDLERLGIIVDADALHAKRFIDWINRFLMA